MFAIAKRVILFLLVNFLVILTISFILSFFNIQPFLEKQGINYQALLIFCLIWGMGGAFISLGLSKIMAKWMMGVQIIDPRETDPSLKQLLDTVHHLAQKAGLPEMPEVGIYQSPELNAFATGPTKSRALVAVSSGLLQRMKWNEIEGVLGHEVTHISNGDMVTMTLLQGVINAFVMFLARILAFFFSGMRDREESSVTTSGSYFLFVILFEVVFMILGSLVTAAFSRYREFKADKGGAQLAGKESMINALKALQRNMSVRDEATDPPAMKALKISSSNSMLALFASHPPLEQRIERLETARL